ncbi:MAG: DUF1761 domain-containing protein [Gammaproteobacteria bacterium]
MGIVEELFGVDFLAILVAAITGFGVGAIWYSPVAFGNLWLRYNPIPDEILQHGPGSKPFIIGFVCTFVQAWVFALFLGWLTSSSMGAVISRGEMVSGAIWAGTLLWLGFTACTALCDAQFAGKSIGGWAIDAAHRLAATLVMAVILGLWMS